MNRRSFFKFLGLGAAGCAVGGAAAVAATKTYSLTFKTYKDGPLKWEGMKYDLLCGDGWELSTGYDKTFTVENYRTTDIFNNAFSK